MRALKKWLRWRFVLLLAALTPPCRRITRMASQGYEQPLGMGMRVRLRLHLLICTACERYVRQLEVLHRAARCSGEKPADLHSSARLSPEARDRLKARLIRIDPS
jgi:hypothetical protein